MLKNTISAICMELSSLHTEGSDIQIDIVEFKMSFVKKAQALIKLCHTGGFACLPSIYLEVLCVLFPISSGQVLQKLKFLVGEMEYKWIIRKPQ